MSALSQAMMRRVAFARIPLRTPSSSSSPTILSRRSASSSSSSYNNAANNAASRTPSATLSPEARLEHEMALSTSRRADRAAALRELQALEHELMRQKMAESQSFAWHLKLHMEKHGPILAAFAGGMASMTASFALWQASHEFGLEKAQLDLQLQSTNNQTQNIRKQYANNYQAVTETISAYTKEKSATVTAPASSFPPSSGWFSWFGSSPSKSNEPATVKYSAWSSEVKQLKQAEKDLLKVYSF